MNVHCESVDKEKYVAHALKRGPSPAESGLSQGKTEMHL